MAFADKNGMLNVEVDKLFTGLPLKVDDHVSLKFTRLDRGTGVWELI